MSLSLRMKKAAQQRWRFKGFISPRYTQVPDALFDDLMAYLSGAELKVLLYIIRRTFGFKKDSDYISLRQLCHGIKTKAGEVLDKGTGLSLSTVQIALKLDDQVFSACNFSIIDFQGVTRQGGFPIVSERRPTPRRRSLILLMFTPFRNCQDKKT
jgi:hypothetical protein